MARLSRTRFSLCQCPPHARPNLATCYGWLIIFDGGLLSEWSRATLGLVSASVIMCLSSPPRLILLLFSFYFKPPHRSPGLLLGETQEEREKKLDLYMTLSDCTARSRCRKDPQNTYLHRLQEPGQHRVGPDNVRLAIFGWVSLLQWRLARSL